MATNKHRPGTRVQVIAPEGTRWLRATVIREDVVVVDMDADPVWGGCELNRGQWKRMRTIDDEEGRQ